MVSAVIKCDYCQDELTYYHGVHTCVLNVDGDIEEVHLCKSCYEYWVVDRPKEQCIEKVISHKIEPYMDLEKRLIG